jgi:ribosomal protein S18 acetylase RimI-like enzyme
MPKMNIRPLTSKDRTAVIQILEDTPEFTPAEVALACELLDAYLDDPPGSGYYHLVAEEGGKVAGYVCYGPAPITEGTWDIYWIAVDRNIQGKGIGRELMAAAEKEIIQAAGRLILVETSSKAGYEKTNLFYQRLGYQEVCRITDFYMIGDDKIVYEKRFSPKP